MVSFEPKDNTKESISNGVVLYCYDTGWRRSTGILKKNYM